MKLSNSIKLAMANFSLFWKILVYKAMAFGISVLLFLPVLSIINECLTASGFYSSVNSLLSVSAFGGLDVFTSNILNCINTLLSGIQLLAQTSVVSIIYVAVLVCFVVPFIFKLSDIPASETTYSYMTSLNKNSFVVNFLDEFSKSAGYSALKTLIEIPFWFLLSLGVYGILSLASISSGFMFVAPLILGIYIVFLFSLKITVLGGWAPSVVAFNLCAGKAFKKGIKSVSRKFPSTLSSFAVITTVMVAVLYIFSFYSLIVIVPLSALIITVFGQVLFFESQGMNYYIAPDNIIKPRKLEQADSIKKVKNII